MIRDHLIGKLTLGVYPLLPDETCWFLAVDFDKKPWQEDMAVFLKTCSEIGVAAALERSRSGKGGHVWMFFDRSVSASLVRKFGCAILTRSMERRHQIGLDSYDRFFPSQDTMPKGGFGNLIALPLQRGPGEKGNSIFVNEAFEPYPDQWRFLSAIERIPLEKVETIVQEASRNGTILGVRISLADDGIEEDPWTLPPSKKKKDKPLQGPFPESVRIVQGSLIYIDKTGLPPAMLNRLIRLAAFQNPDFYKAQAMRLSTFGKPRIIGCAEDFPSYIDLPRGCLDDAPETADVRIQDIYGALVLDKDRNELIFDDLLKALAMGRSPLLLTERVEHLEQFAEQLKGFAQNIIVLKGGMGSKQRKAMADQIKAVPDSKERVILSTGRYIGEGFDDARLDTLFLAMPISWRGTLQQDVGRLHRLHDNKQVVQVYDYVDIHVPTLMRMYKKRVKGYEAIGYSTQNGPDV